MSYKRVDGLKFPPGTPGILPEQKLQFRKIVRDLCARYGVDWKSTYSPELIIIEGIAEKHAILHYYRIKPGLVDLKTRDFLQRTQRDIERAIAQLDKTSGTTPAPPATPSQEKTDARQRAAAKYADNA